MRKKSGKRVLALLLVCAMAASLVPGLELTASAATAWVTEKVVDPSRVNDYIAAFPADDTVNAGGVWTDKSVFASAADLKAELTKTSADIAGETYALTPETGVNALTEVGQDNFLVALSALASNKTIVGYSNLPTDTILILDASGSMRGTASSALVAAANDAIKTLQSTNPYNRVGVVLYSGNTQNDDSNLSHAVELLPLGRYDQYRQYTERVRVGRNQWREEIVTEEDQYLKFSDNTISVNQGVTLEGTQTGVTVRSKSVSGGTYIQSGLQLALNEFLSIEDTTIEGTGFQSGTVRMPIMVLMSDGAPTAATTSYANVQTSNMGDGSSTNERIAFATQLTAAYVKQQVEAHYGRSSLFYTLGYGVGSTELARCVMDPADSPQTVQSYWDAFLKLSPGGYLRLNDNRSVQRVDDGITADNYLYTTEYFEAGNTSKLQEAFEKIVQQIILQSMYYPTLVEEGNAELGGYLAFEDNIGLYMDVKDVKGILMGDHLYTGEMLSRNFVTGGGDLGTVDAPTEMGDAFIGAVQARLGITSVETARALVRLAFQYKQLSYTSETEYSNYIGWYGDADNNYLGFYHEGVTTAPAGAVYANKSYGMLGTVTEGQRVSDMMYISIQVHTNIATGEQTVLWQIPAALIPLVTYKVSLNGTSLEESTFKSLVCEGNTPIRLLYEVGLRDDINELTVTEKVSEDYAYRNIDGTYSFYTNQWTVYEDADDVHTTEDHNAVSDAKDTYSFFAPSEENERYYYHENAPVYILSGGTYVKYTGSQAPSGEGYFRKYYHFTDTEKLEGYEPITAQSMARVQAAGDGTWYIPKGVIHRYLETFMQAKSVNVTRSLQCANHPAVELLTHDGYTHYHSESILGNNGRLTVEPDTGIKVTKTLDQTMAAGWAAEKFSFTLTGPAGEYRLIVENTDGTYQTAVEAEITGADGFTFELLAGQTAWLVDLTEDETYTVRENTTGKEYGVQSVNGQAADQAQITVELHQLAEAAFVNGLKADGSLILSKTVSHPFGPAYVIPDEISFTFEVTLTDAQGVALAGQSFPTSVAGESVTTDADGKFTYELKADASVTIQELPEGTQISVEETELPDGFTAEEAVKTGSIAGDAGTVMAFTNTYAPEEVLSVNLSLTGDKTYLKDSGWDDEVFSFRLQRLDGANWVTVGDDQTVDKTDASFAFAALADETFDAPGVYSYRVTENVGNDGGVVYDRTNCYFDIVVADEDMDGKLEIKEVRQGTATTVNYDQEDQIYEIHVDFTNTYSVDGPAGVEIELEKSVDNTAAGTALHNGGFQFDLTAAAVDAETGAFTKVAGAEPMTTVSADTGAAVFSVAFTGEGTSYYILEENSEDDLDGMTYSDVRYGVTAVVGDDGDGNRTVAVTAALLDEDGVPDASAAYTAEATATDEDPVPVAVLEIEEAFVNVYEPDDAVLDLSGGKTLTGKDMEDGMFRFKLTPVESDFATAAGQSLETENEGEGVTFEDLTFDAVDTYYFLLEEVDDGEAGYTYDSTVYHVTVAVTDDGTGALTASARYTTADGVPVQTPTFANAYVPAPVSFLLGGAKVMENKLLTADTYTFDLVELDEDGAVKDGGLTLSAKNTVTPGDAYRGGFAFDDPASGADEDYTAVYTHTGKWYYKITERDGNLGGVTYDTSEYVVTVTVTDVGGQLSASQSVTKNGGTADTVVFSNRYEAKWPEGEGSVTISGAKTILGGTPESGSFTISLYEADAQFDKVGQAVQTAEISAADLADGREAFSFTLDMRDKTPNTYRYVIVEEDGGLAKVGYDATVYTLTVVVADNGQGSLTVRHTLAYLHLPGVTPTAADFKNTYTEDLDVSIEVDKTVTGDDLSPEGFKVILKQYTDETYTTVEKTWDAVAFDADGKASLPLTFTKEDIGEVFYYTVTEEQGSQRFVTYDDTLCKLSVEVLLDQASNTLQTKIVKTVDDGEPEVVTEPAVSFTNSYDLPDDAQLYLFVEKTVTGGITKQSPEGYSFVLTKYADAAYETVEKEVQTVTSGEDGFAAFDALTYSISDEGRTFYYTVHEEDDGRRNITYDDTVYRLAVTVSLNEDDELVATVTCNGTVIEGRAELDFVNRYRIPWTPGGGSDPDPDPDPDPDLTPDPKPVVSPDTGDHTLTGLWIGLIAVGFAGLTAVLALLERERRRGRG